MSCPALYHILLLSDPLFDLLYPYKDCVPHLYVLREDNNSCVEVERGACFRSFSKRERRDLGLNLANFFSFLSRPSLLFALWMYWICSITHPDGKMNLFLVILKK